MTHCLRVGVGGPVGSGKTALLKQLCLALRDHYDIAVVTNDIYTREDAEALMRAQVLPSERIRGVETGGCPHTAIREDASINLAAVADLAEALPEGTVDALLVCLEHEGLRLRSAQRSILLIREALDGSVFVDRL